MKYSPFIALGLALSLSVGFAGAQTTQRFTAGKANEYGLVYSLPLTELEITIESEHTVSRPGEFYNYARKHLSINNAVTEEKNDVKILSVTINPKGVADPENQWLVQFKSGSTPWMLLTADGRPLTINSDTAEDIEPVDLPLPKAPQPTILETEIARQAMTQDMIRSSSISKRAELAAARIFELREMRSDILSGQADNAPSDGAAMQLVLDNLAKQEEALTAMFAGTVSKWTEVRTFTLQPDAESPLVDEVFARISPFDGILDPDNLAGAPITITIDELVLGELPVNEKGEEKKFPKGGVAYQIPGSARVNISYEGAVIASKNLSFSQFGVTFGLDPSLFTDKKSPSQLRFDPTTGGILLLGPAQQAN